MLTLDTTDTHPILRKPLAYKMSPPQTPPPPPPPPYVASEADDEVSSPKTRPIAQEDLENNVAALHLQEIPQAEIRQVLPESQLEAPEIPEFSFSFSAHQTPQILAPIPPSPEIPRATLTNQEPAAQTGARRASGTDSDGESPKQARLQKENRTSRSRSSSLFQPKLSEQQSQSGNVHPGQQSPILEPRGRRSISAQASLAPSGSGSLALNSRSASSHDGSQSPTRGKLRRSWLPGGGRSRSNSVDVNNANKSEAWIMSEETQADYNPSILKNGEKVYE